MREKLNENSEATCVGRGKGEGVKNDSKIPSVSHLEGSRELPKFCFGLALMVEA